MASSCVATSLDGVQTLLDGVLTLSDGVLTLNDVVLTSLVLRENRGALRVDPSVELRVGVDHVLECRRQANPRQIGVARSCIKHERSDVLQAFVGLSPYVPNDEEVVHRKDQVLL